MSDADEQYLTCLSMAANGRPVATRASLESTKQKVSATSAFGYQARYNLQYGFPLLTTRQISFKIVREELLWFLKGETNVRSLQEKGVHIWDEWADEQGNLGPVYGALWRDWRGETRRVDQIATLIENIRQVADNPDHPARRRLIVTAWDPSRVEEMALPACHCFFQCAVEGPYLHLQLYQRSADVFLGVPYNVASYALLLSGLAKVTGLVPGYFIHTFGDLHLYENHREQADELFIRPKYPAPKLKLVGMEEWDGSPVDELIQVISFASLLGYQHSGILTGEVAR